ncbi:MAG TPA: hypothetical protein VLG44_05815 [Chlamydiales bacterium]|nr:hypothetical protein [Chlamydiales bacterium]
MAAVTKPTRFIDGFWGTVDMPSRAAVPKDKCKATADSIQLLLRNGDTIDLYYVTSSSGCTLTARDLQLLSTNRLRVLLKAASDYFSSPGVEFSDNQTTHFTISSQAAKAYVDAVNQAEKYIKGGPNAPIERYSGDRCTSLSNIEAISKEVLTKPAVEPSPLVGKVNRWSSHLGNAFYFVPATIKVLALFLLPVLLPVHAIMHVFTLLAPFFYLTNSVTSGYIAKKSDQEAGISHDREGQVEARLQAGEAFFLGAGSISWGAALFHDEGIGHIDSPITDWFNIVSYIFWCLGYAAGIGKNAYFIWEGRGFRNELNALFKNDNPIQERAKETLYFLKDQISITNDDVEEITKEARAENPDATSDELQKIIEKKAAAKLESKIAHFKRKVGPEAAKEIIENIDSIISKMESTTPEDVLQEAVDLIELVKDKNTELRNGAISGIIVNLVGFAVSLALAIATFGTFHLITIGIPALVILLTYFLTKLLNKYSSRTQA